MTWLIGIALGAFKGLGKLLLNPTVLMILAACALLAAVWIQTKSLDRMTADRNNWRRSSADGFAYAKAWHGSFDKSEALRRGERSGAVAAINEAGKACQARVSAARASAAKIEVLVTKEPTYDANHCPLRGIINSDELRDATGWPGQDR